MRIQESSQAKENFQDEKAERCGFKDMSSFVRFSGTALGRTHAFTCRTSKAIEIRFGKLCAEVETPLPPDKPRVPR